MWTRWPKEDGRKISLGFQGRGEPWDVDAVMVGKMGETKEEENVVTAAANLGT